MGPRRRLLRCRGRGSTFFTRFAFVLIVPVVLHLGFIVLLLPLLLPLLVLLLRFGQTGLRGWGDRSRGLGRPADDMPLGQAGRVHLCLTRAAEPANILLGRVPRSDLELLAHSVGQTRGTRGGDTDRSVSQRVAQQVGSQKQRERRDIVRRARGYEWRTRRTSRLACGFRE